MTGLEAQGCRFSNWALIIGIPAVLLLHAPANAQRAGENAVTSATDAFGSSIGNERIGLYHPGLARGFSPADAGNIRLEGLYVDMQADFTSRVVVGATMRVGITAQSYPFVAPTGIADFSLRKAGNEPVLSVIAGVGPFDAARLEMDGQVPLTKTLSLAGGVGVSREAYSFGGDGRFTDAALIPHWRPNDNIEVLPFVAYFDVSGRDAATIYFPEGSQLPPPIKRRRYFSPEWAQNEARGLNYGIVSRLTSGDWALQTGFFRSRLDFDFSATEIALNVTPDGLADRHVALDADRLFASTSGEIRATRSFQEGDRLHKVHIAVRGRDQNRRYGGGQLVSLGRARIDEVIDRPSPEFLVKAQTRDQVRQFTAGVGYEGRWRDVGELTLGVQRTDYRKSVETPSGPLPLSYDGPWLLNGAATVHVTPWLSAYMGYAKGLEESPVAPSVARNRDQASPAVLTEQVDAGVRLILPANLRLVAGVFQVSKPYFGLDNTMLFRTLGNVRHRGAEISLAGEPLPNLTAILGAVLLDATLSGEEVEQGSVGARPVGSLGRHLTGSLNYVLPFAPKASVDLAFESTSERVGDVLNTFVVPSRYVVAVGGRYRFSMRGAPATLRAQVANLNNSYGWSHAGQGFQYNVPRRFSLSLSTDI